MEEDKYIFLTNASDIEVDLFCQKLKDNGIPSKIQDYNQNVVFSSYGANSIIGKRIFVPESKVDIAMDVLDLDKNKESDKNFLFSKSNRPLFKTVRVIIAIFLIILAVLYIINFFQLLYINQ